MSETATEATHTPGPWVVKPLAIVRTDNKHANFRHAIDSANGVPICGLWHREIPYANPNHPKARNFSADAAEVEANAQLIAAAPDLLASCKALVEMYSAVAPYGLSPVVLNAIEVIAKIEGK